MVFGARFVASRSTSCLREAAINASRGAPAFPRAFQGLDEGAMLCHGVSHATHIPVVATDTNGIPVTGLELDGCSRQRRVTPGGSSASAHGVQR